MRQLDCGLLFFAVCCLAALVACDEDGDQVPGPNGGSAGAAATEHFSFFVTSLKAMQELSGNDDGFGGDLRFGETGARAGLRGADKICATIAEKSMPGNGKTWRAFLSATSGEDGQQVDAIDRIGEGPWYDRAGRLLALNKTDLAQVRPEGADDAIVDDLPNEDGVPNHAPDPTLGEVDNHDVLTGTNENGRLFSAEPGSTCNDWTSIVADLGQPRCGHSWPRRGAPNGPMGGPGGPAPGGGGSFGMMVGGGGAPFDEGELGVSGGFGAGGQVVVGGPGPNGLNSGDNWMSALNESGCAPGAFVVEAGPPGANGTQSVGDGGGYGGIYCFALTP